MLIAKTTLAKIHIAKQQLAMTDDEYRTVLRSVAGVGSAKDLTPEGAHKLLKHFERCGFQPKRPVGRRPNVEASRAYRLRKIEALLAASGRPWSYLDGMVKRICKVDAIEFCDGEMLGKLIAALQYDANRRERV
ncbi:gp16 family protein [Burkholderia cenocepacia]|uniref:gp16 family protein n=1 Tax=Burkholderia cenocepacia TaxID=95486 RepID=UPI0013F1349D|nr:regulatory protein GemA [Burkholderia cenocepacia]MCW3583865.1 regulatory protein GemA [Burkholderia cenocepacia]MCW3629316.1 regulatory protein GemA [Burkholderia cenocepacia]MCW5181870.1 regulatory protein GemA [Burkholderia cenocepacia]NGO94324.1 GemA protein [Burkholderia cenocepacia]